MAEDFSDTPTADAAETFLKESGMFYSNIPKDPYGVDNVVSHVLKFMGYPIQFKEGAVDIHHQPLPDHIQVMVGTKDTRFKINQIYQLLSSYEKYDWVAQVSKGGIVSIVRKLNNDELYFRGSSLVEIRESKTPENEEAVKRCIMRAYERALEGDQRLNNPDFTQKVFPESERLYRKLKKEGVRPIDPEALGGLIASCISDILRVHPELNP